jgi:pyruvate/2-oxoglutarate dehydrogenase complex dihydrolipoamide acyltransferase (E2) component
VSSLPIDPSAETVEVAMPQMGVSVTEGTVVLWHKHPGDRVRAEETICEITTDKIDCEVPAPASGVLAELLVEPEQTVPVGTVLARIAADARETPHDGSAAAAVPVREDPSPPAESLNGHDDADRLRSSHYSPVVLRIAEREGVDLSAVAGTGREGRVRKQDVLAFVAARGASAGEPAPLHIESPYREEAPEGPVTDGAERLSRMRRSIAAHMTESLRTAAHCTSITEADMSRVETARKQLGLSWLPFVARCTVEALQAHPDLNATLEDEMLTRHRAVHLGIAVSLGSDGLIVPVIHDAQDLSAEGLGKRIAELARRARAGELSADDVRGGTFTITNPGGYGTIASTPIINQPQVAILDLEAVVRRPVAVSDGRGGDAVAIRPMTNLCLSWDHRALDGALAAQFLGAVRERIERWEDH